MKLRSLAALVVATAAVPLAAASPASAGHGTPTVPPQPIADSQLQAVTTTTVGGGADVLPTTRTIPHWWGSTTDPLDGVTYGYDIVGSNPYTCAGAACAATVEVDVTPVILDVDGMTFSGSDVLGAALASPEFALHDYGSTPFATNPHDASRGPGGVLSQGDAGNPLQLQDAVMRAQFDRTGVSPYHLSLHPNALPPVTIDVPQNQGMLLRNEHGIVFAAVDIQWWTAQIQNLEAGADPRHLALYLTDDTLTYLGNARAFTLYASGFHGTRAAGSGAGSTSSNGDAAVQTFAWATWLSPGLFSGTNDGPLWGLQDMNVLSHEIAEWANDPFVDNFVQPWPFVPGFPQYGCSPVLETADAVGWAGFAMGTNTFRQGPNPDGTQSADGNYHPQDELTLPWFLRLAPNTVSEPTQMPSPNVGRYTFLGDLNGAREFAESAPAC